MIAKFKQVQNAFAKWKKKVMAPEAKIQGFFARELYPLYQNKQTTRWITQGASEKMPFKEASDRWVKRKIEQKRRFPSQYPGGSKKLVYTGDLAMSVIGQGVEGGAGSQGLRYHRPSFSSSKMVVATAIPYAKYVVNWMGVNQSFMRFGKDSTEEFRSRIARFLRKEFASGG